MKRAMIRPGGLAFILGIWLAVALPAGAQTLSFVARHFAGGSSVPSAQPPAGHNAGLHLPFSPGAATPGEPSGDPPVARYVVQNTTLTLDLSGPQPLLRYNNSTEIYALRRQPGPRGDVIYTNDAGEMMLKATGLGGLTAFTPDQPQGIPAAFIGSAPALGIPDIRNGFMVGQHLQQASGHMSKVSGHEIDLSAQNLSGPEVLPLVFDTATVMVQAFDRAMAPANAKKKYFLSDLSLVNIIEGRPPSAKVDNNILTVVITPEMGVAGRPSSARILKALFR